MLATSACTVRVSPKAKSVKIVSRPVNQRIVSANASKAKFFVGGNWKCNGDSATVKTLVEDLNKGKVPSDVDVVCAPPFIFLDYVNKNLDKSKYAVSAQNCWVGKNGAYTGEVSADMLVNAQIPWVILGHSERRAIFNESSEFVAKKSAYALSKGLGIIPCIGETLEQRNSGKMFEVLTSQMEPLFKEIKDWSKVVIAYEPVWAIGTGVVATPAQAQEVHAFLRKLLVEKLGKDTAETIRILYGGSVNDKNCKVLAGQEDIDGFLVGGASLVGSSFVTICNANAK